MSLTSYGLGVLFWGNFLMKHLSPVIIRMLFKGKPPTSG